MKKSDATVLVARIAAAFPNATMRPGTPDEFASGLNDIDIDDAFDALDTWKRKSSFAPTVADIRRLVAPSSLSVERDHLRRFPQVLAECDETDLRWRVDKLERMKRTATADGNQLAVDILQQQLDKTRDALSAVT